MIRSNALLRAISNELQFLYPAPEAQSIAFFVIQEVYEITKTKILSDIELDESKCEQVRAQLQQGIPVQYALGYAWFLEEKFITRPGVLIPRQETEELVQWIVELEKDNIPETLLDIGTGSGCIAISLKKKLNIPNTIAIDISENALSIAKENAALHQVEIQFLQQDVLDYNIPLPMCDCIVSNPPYVCEFEKELMSAHVVDHEPASALFVPDHDPFLFYTTIAGQAMSSLKAGGRMYFEINERYGPNLKEMLEDMGFTSVELKKDFHGKDRFIRAVR